MSLRLYSALFQRRQWQPTPVLLPGKSHGQRGLVGCSPWGHKESDTTERLHFHFSLSCIGEGNGNLLSVLVWRIPGTGEPGGLPSMGSHRVRHDWSNLAAAAAACLLPWRWHIFFFVFDIYHGLWGTEEKKNASTTSKSGSIEIFYIPYIILSSKCLVRCRRFPVSSQKKYLPYTN